MVPRYGCTKISCRDFDKQIVKLPEPFDDAGPHRWPAARNTPRSFFPKVRLTAYAVLFL